MPYRLEVGEAFDEAFRRCAAEQLDGAIEELTEGVKKDPVDAVHSARKALKKERSLLRLSRGSLDPRERREQNATLREAASRLSGARDADVMIEALSELGERYAGQLPKRSFNAISKRLQKSRDALRHGLVDEDTLDAVTQQLVDVRQLSVQWRLHGRGWPAIEPGLLNTYQRGRKALNEVRHDPTVENVHDWRKRAKDLWYQLRLLGPVSPQTMKGHAQEAHLLADLLGDDHDLAVLRDALLERCDEITVDLDPVIALIELRREELQQQAMFLGERIYAEKPKAFVRRIHAYWRAARAEHRNAASQRPARVAKRARSRAHATA